MSYNRPPNGQYPPPPPQGQQYPSQGQTYAPQRQQSYSQQAQAQGYYQSAPPPQQQQGYAGYGAHPQGPPPQVHRGSYHAPLTPAGADPQLWSWFCAVDEDSSGAISAPELRKALLNGDWSNFDLDTVKMLMGIFDVDHNGTITFNEFAGLWKYIKDWQNVFRHFDADRSGSIDRAELAAALNQFGYRLSPQLLAVLEKKYALQASLPQDESRVQLQPGITFDRFVRACVVVRQLTEAFQTLDTDRDNWIQINYEQFMNIVLSAP